MSLTSANAKLLQDRVDRRIQRDAQREIVLAAALEAAKESDDGSEKENVDGNGGKLPELPSGNSCMDLRQSI
jgi:hypothetical protein